MWMLECPTSKMASQGAYPKAKVPVTGVSDSSVPDANYPPPPTNGWRPPRGEGGGGWEGGGAGRGDGGGFCGGGGGHLCSV